MKNVTIENIDIDLLQKQKNVLIGIIDSGILLTKQQEAMEGMLSLLDSITDQFPQGPNYEELSEMIGSGENPEATEIWNSLTEEQKEEFIDYQYEQFTDFSEFGNWEDGKAPTREQIKNDTLFLLEGKEYL